MKRGNFKINSSEMTVGVMAAEIRELLSRYSTQMDKGMV